MTLRSLLIGAALAGCVHAQAQTVNSFHPLDAFSDIYITSGPGLFEYVLSLGPAPMITLDGVDYDVNLVFGFWTISDSGDLVASGADQNAWNYYENSTNLAGWKNPSKMAAIHPSENLSFSYSALNTSAVDDYGLHVQVVGQLPDGSNTIHVRLVPEPGAIAGVFTGLGALAALRRRKA